MQNKLQITVKEQTELTAFLNGIVKGAENKDQWITLQDFAGFVRLFQCIYTPVINVKFNEDEKFYHIAITEDKKFVAAIKSLKEQPSCLPVRNFIRVDTLTSSKVCHA